MKKIMSRFLWSMVLVLCILSAIIYIFVNRCGFLALLVFGIAMVIACYLLLGFLKKRHKKLGALLLWTFSAGLCIGLFAAVYTGILVGSTAGGSDDTCEYVIVLGAGVQGTTPSRSLQDRIDAASHYLTKHPDVICIVSGGQGPGEDITEARCMADALTAMGIDPSRIWQENRSTSTQENIAFSLDLIEQKTGIRPDTVGILSSEYHLYRAGMVAKAQGVATIGIPAETGWLHLYINYFLREIFVVWYYAVFY